MKCKLHFIHNANFLIHTNQVQRVLLGCIADSLPTDKASHLPWAGPAPAVPPETGVSRLV